jgi:hypothetical protein
VSAFAEEKAATERLLTGRTRIEAELAKVIVGTAGRDRADPDRAARRRSLPHHRCAGPGEDAAREIDRAGLPPQLSSVSSLRPDLMPADVTGTEILQESGDGGAS